MQHHEATMSTAEQEHSNKRSDPIPPEANAQGNLWKPGQTEWLIIICCCIIAVVIALDATILVPLLPVGMK